MNVDRSTYHDSEGMSIVIYAAEADSFVGKVIQIGGPGIIVEIDESKFGKRKFNVGHRVEGK